MSLSFMYLKSRINRLRFYKTLGNFISLGETWGLIWTDLDALSMFHYDYNKFLHSGSLIDQSHIKFSSLAAKLFVCVVIRQISDRKTRFIAFGYNQTSHDRVQARKAKGVAMHFLSQTFHDLSNIRLVAVL